MKLEHVYEPIQKEIEEVRRELNALIPTFDFPSTIAILDKFSRMSGKLLRPALLLLSAKAVAADPSSEGTRALVLSAVGVELVHDASLVHDDILDNDHERRGQPTVNALWGTKVAVLTGDVLYSRAYGLLTDTLSLELLRRVVRLSEAMCSAEIEQARTLDRGLTREEYFRIIEGKTAAFMSLACRLGASLAGGDDRQVEDLAQFGLSFGLAYQLFDDREDGDLGCAEVDALAEGRSHADRAIELIGGFPASPSRDRLMDLVRYLVEVNS